MQKIQPELKRIQAENKTNPQQQTALLLEVYKTNRINPSFAFFFAFFQIFIIFGMFSAFSIAIRPDFIQFLYPTVSNLIKGPINYTLLNILDLSQPSLLLAIFATATQVIHGMITLKHLNNDDPQKNMMKIFTYVFPIIFILNFKHFKSAIFLY
jgi:membrane protein insertase Oxa1/YidC/SpoIIIJ